MLFVSDDKKLPNSFVLTGCAKALRATTSDADILADL